MNFLTENNMKKTLIASILMLALVGCKAPTSETNVTQSQSKTVDQTITQNEKELDANKNNPKNADPSANVNSAVELIDAGQDPKQEVFFTPTVNSSETLIMTMDMSMNLSVNGQSAPAMENPKIKMEMGLNITNIEENGDISADFEYKNVEVIASANTPPEVVTAMNTEMSKIKGFKGSLVIDKYGNTKDASFDLPETMDPSLKQMMQQMLNSFKELSSPLPSEAVGVGAKWTTNQSVNLNGMNLDQVMNYEIMKIDGKDLTLKVSFNQTANGQKIESPQLPPNTTMELVSLTGSGNGEIFINLDRLMPVNSNIQSQSTTEMKITKEGNPQVNVLKSNTDINLVLTSQ
jgi:hypothetical protein